MRPRRAAVERRHGSSLAADVRFIDRFLTRARRPERYAAGVQLLGFVLTLGFLFLSDASALIHRPAPVVSLCVLLAGLVALQHPVLDAEDRWRRDAVLDPLTGLLNRQGLGRRFAELADADQHMCEAKRGGRNAVCATGATAMLDTPV